MNATSAAMADMLAGITRPIRRTVAEVVLLVHEVDGHTHTMAFRNMACARRYVDGNLPQFLPLHGPRDATELHTALPRKNESLSLVTSLVRDH